MKTKLRLIVLLCPLLLCVLPAKAQDKTTPAATTPPTASATVPTQAPTPDVAAASPTIDPAKAAEIHKLLDISGTTKNMNMMVDQMISSFKMQNSDVPAEFWDRFKAEMNYQGLVEKLIPLYDKYYTMDDLKAAITFYQSPAGQHMLTVTPKLMQESMQIGQEWGTAVGTKVQEEIEKERQKESAAAPAPATTAPASSAPAATAPAAAPTPATTAPAAPTPSST